MDLDKLKELLIKHEGLRLFPYPDTLGNMSIGIGRNLYGKGITKDEALYLLQNDIDEAACNLYSIFAKFYDFSENRQHALVSMMFMGKASFETFQKMIFHINKDEWEGAADEVLKSKYAVQVGTRAIEIAGMLRKG